VVLNMRARMEEMRQEMEETMQGSPGTIEECRCGQSAPRGDFSAGRKAGPKPKRRWLSGCHSELGGYEEMRE